MPLKLANGPSLGPIKDGGGIKGGGVGMGAGGWLVDCQRWLLQESCCRLGSPVRVERGLSGLRAVACGGVHRPAGNAH